MNKSTIVKNFLKFMMSLSPLYLLIGYYILWSYLDDIGRLNIFSSILDNKMTLLALMISFAFLSTSVICIIFLPSIILIKTTFFTWGSNLSRVIELRKIPLISCAISILYISSIIFLSTAIFIPQYIKAYAFLITVVSLLPLVFLSIHFMSKNRKKNHIYYINGKEFSKKYFLKEKSLISIMVLFSGLTITLPLLFILNLSTAQSSYGVINLLVILLLSIFIAHLPAMLLLTNGRLIPNIKEKAFSFIACTLILFTITMSLLPNFSSIVERAALKNIGIIDGEPHIYSLKKQNYSSEMFPSSIWGNINSNNSIYIFIKGTVFLSLGEKILICPEFVTNARNKYMKYNLDHLFSGSSKDNFHSSHLKQLFKSCALINKPDINQWDNIYDGKNMLN